jgi:phosphohistidine swiveling domain-containing protein
MDKQLDRMSLLEFSGKAETLNQLRGRLRNATLLPQLHFSLKDWWDAGSRWESLGLDAEWLSGALIVRSSAKAEDQHLQSSAGQFLSVADVIGTVALQEAIQSVIESFEDENADHQILIQPMLKNVLVSGVAFSYEPGQPAPYYVINYDDVSGSSHQVTQGLNDQLKLIYIAKSARPKLQGWKKKLLQLLKELERLFGNDAIDVEYVVTSDGELVLLQVRPLVIAKERLLTVSRQKEVLQQLKESFRRACLHHDPCKGKTNLLGVMPDWNPAEIIGLRPKPLAFSLYRFLVTDLTWAQQRHEYGYRDVRGVPLMLNLCGIPYVDIRASFNSFVPRELPDELAARLVEFYLHRLKQHPQWHDKVEFNIVLASDYFGIQEDLNPLLNHGFSEQDCNLIYSTLRAQTHKIIDAEKGYWQSERKKVQQLPVLQKAISESSLDDKEKLVGLLELCRDYGARPFAGLARTAFVAMKFLRSLVKVGVITAEDMELFMRSLSTLSGGLLNSGSTSSRQQFQKQYGHMRAGMYDLLSPRYDEMPQEYFSWEIPTEPEMRSQLILDECQEIQLDSLLAQHGINYTSSDFMEFIRLAIEWREKAKFIFSQTLSEILTLSQKLGQKYQLTDRQLVHLDINQIIQLTETEKALKLVKKSESRFEITRSLILPSLITSEDEIDYFEVHAQEPNFITLNRATAHVVTLSSNSSALSEDLTGAIVVLTQADPGFDWIFIHNIAGLVTLYGGSNSHIAIRAAEMGIPAVVGAGEVLFQRCLNAKLLSLDCEQQKVYRLK